MPLTSTLRTGKREIPHEPGQWMDFQMLNWVTLNLSKKIRLAELHKETTTLSRETLEQLRAELAAAKVAGVDIAADPLIRHDRLTLLTYGIAEWSYGDTIEPSNIDDRTSEWAAREILAFSDPTGDDIKKDSSRATGS